MEFRDFRGEPLSKGDRVIPIAWGDIPLWLSNTPGVIVGFGRTRVKVEFDGVRYNAPGDKPHAVPPHYLRKL